MNQTTHLAFRGLQLLLAIILLCFTVYIVDHTFSPSQAIFLLFTSVWTIFPALTYLALAPRFHSREGYSKSADPIIDIITALFWFAGFIALAVWYHRLDFCYGRACKIIVTTCVLGALEW
ncbi:MAG: hypothetical protein LQ350_001511 [Teloschistes chrysophthalmus]|nr:MAG: hypothetical protein LQ350_001511 [Niorma chrysophthalma]